MTSIIIAMLASAVLGLTVALIGLRRRTATVEASSVQQQLVELRDRLDRIVVSSNDVPRALAERSSEQVQSLAEVREQLMRVAEATARLEDVGVSIAEVQELLQVPPLRGALGELWLEDLLRQVFPTGFYELQYSFKSGERVDAVLRVGGRLIPVDSKFPLAACQRFLRADRSGADRDRAAFRRALKTRIDEIAHKYIKPDEGTYEFAFMYVPAENVYYEAVIRDGRLDDRDSVVGYALKRKVILVSPNTFYAYLVSVLHGLRGLEIESRADDVLHALVDLDGRLERFAEGFSVLGRHLSNAGKAFDEADRKLMLLRHHCKQIADPVSHPESALEMNG